MNDSVNRVKYILKECYICHAFGRTFTRANYILENNFNNKIKINPDITLVSPMNEYCYKNSYLVKQLNLNDIPVMKSNKIFYINEADWNNTFKIEAIIEILEKTTTEFAVVLDGKDTCIIKDLDNNFINDFKKYNADIVYNSMAERYPNIRLDGEQSLTNTNHCYINAGLCIGYTDKLLDFYKECLANINNTVNGWDDKPSEQYIVRYTAINSSVIVKCDYNKTLFNRPERKVRY